MSTTAPKFAELQGLVHSMLTKAFAGTRIGVVLDDALKDSNVESHLRAEGACIVVAPLVMGVLRDQDGPAFILDAEVMVKVQFNVSQNASPEGANLNIYSVVVKVIQSLCSAKRATPGSEFFKASKDCVSLSMFDQGMWAYDLLFTKEAVL